VSFARNCKTYPATITATKWSLTANHWLVCLYRICAFSKKMLFVTLTSEPMTLKMSSVTSNCDVSLNTSRTHSRDTWETTRRNANDLFTSKSNHFIFVPNQGRSQGFQSQGVTGKAAPYEARRADGWGPKGRWLRPEGPKAGVGFLLPIGFSIFWVLWMASPVNIIRCHDVFSSSFIYFAHYRVRLTVIIPH